MKTIHPNPPANIRRAQSVADRGEIAADASDSSRLSHRKWQAAGAAVVIVAAFIRLYQLTIAPLHHDEAVNGNFLVALYRLGNSAYKYDPANYHGPSLFYFALIVTKLNGLLIRQEGLTTYAIKLVPAIFGVATVLLMLRLRRYLGAWGTLGAATLIALSPGAVYFSRYFIHEILFTFFTLAFVVTALDYRRTAKPLYLLLASASAALLVTTKETSIITLTVFALSYLCMKGFLALRKPPARKEQRRKTPARTGKASSTTANQTPAKWISRAGGRSKAIVLSLVAIAVFLFVHLALYTSFFTNSHGVFDSVATYATWLNTGENAYRADPSTYLRWMADQEIVTLVLGALGIILALYRARSRLAVFSAFWAMGEFCAYSLIPYKTPWLTLNILLPLALVGGYAVEEIVSSVKKSSRQRVQVGMWCVLALAISVSTIQAVKLSYLTFDDDHNPYVYGHTQRQFLAMVDQINHVIAMNKLGDHVGITVASPEYWPLPWYTRNDPNAGYWGKVIPTHEAFVIDEDQQEGEIQQTLGNAYDQVGTYPLRPGVLLHLYVRKDLAK
jgi:uncharacterized protein (TIGR03663 family)